LAVHYSWLTFQDTIMKIAIKVQTLTGGLLAGPRHGLRSDGSLAKPMKQAGNRKKQ
jgi:hypothetical protein